MMAFDSCTSEKNVRPEPEYTAASPDKRTEQSLHFAP
jgi:hypothetical protein